MADAIGRENGTTYSTLVVGSRQRLWLIVSFTMLFCGTTQVLGGDLKNIVTDLYGGDGIILAPPMSGPSHAPHFQASSLQGLDDIGSALAGTLGFASFNSVVTGFTLDLETGEPVRTTDSLGPLLAESATTLGERKLNMGFTFTRSKFNRFDGKGTGDLSFTLNHPDTNFDGMLTGFELDVIDVAINLDITQEVYVMFATYGVTSDWDVGIVIPIVTLRARADAFATIVDNSPGPNPHFFDTAPGSDQPQSTIYRTKTGFGDFVLRTKYNFVRDDEELPDMAIGGQIVLPTGDQDNLLGTGETRLKAILIASKAFGWFTPHVNLGYELAPGDNRLNNLNYFVGFDITLDPKWTVAFDILGRWEHSGDGVGDRIIDAAIGAKWDVDGTTLLNFYFLFPLNRDEGLRADVVWSIGVEQTF